MGGCYDRVDTYRERVDQAQINLKRTFTLFFNSGEKKHLISAYKQMLKEGSADGFIKKLHDYSKVTVAPKEFGNYEIEAKLNIALKANGKQAAKSAMPSATTLAGMFDFQPTDNALFLRDEMLAKSSGTNAFYGTEDGEERLALIHKGGQYFKKEKGNIMPYKFGIPFEEYILKRSETRIPTNPAEVAEAMMRLNKDGKMKYVGTVDKEKVDFFVLNTISGREYGCTVSKATLQGNSDEVQHQLELEYAGYVPGFRGMHLNNEEEVVNEISQLYRLLLVGYGMAPVPVNDNWSMQLQPTRERKFDFAGGKKEAKSLEKVIDIKQKKLLLVT